MPLKFLLLELPKTKNYGDLKNVSFTVDFAWNFTGNC